VINVNNFFDSKHDRYTTKLVLAGDHLQLPPTVLSNNSKVKAVLGVSMMERLVKEFKGSSMVRMLDTQYRMAEPIMRWSSDTFYDGKLKAGPGIGIQTLSDRKLPGVRPATLITKKQLLLVDTKGKMRQKGSNAPVQNPLSASLQNPGEAKIVVKIVKQLSHSGVMPEQIGVISFYALQVDKIRQQLDANSFNNVKVNTVDGFQGQEKEVIILSTVRSNREKDIGFLKEKRRLNVAVTRAKRLLVMVADRQTLQNSKTYEAFFKHVQKNGEITCV
jgi:superfamily I DNA and/or RNA helicase